jgi:chromosome segregation ATPase
MEENKIVESIVQLQADVLDIKEKIKNVPENLDTILTVQDKITGMLKNIHTEMAATNHALLRHEGRIERLEDDVEELQTHLVIV